MSQDIIIAGDGKEYGPVSAQDVREWVRTGRANGDTRIKPEEAKNWKRLRDLPEFECDLAPGATPAPIAVDSALPNQGQEAGNVHAGSRNICLSTSSVWNSYTHLFNR